MTSDNFDGNNYDNGNNMPYARYPSSFHTNYMNGPSMDQYFEETQHRPETSDRNTNTNNNYKQNSMFDSEISKFFNEKYNGANEDKNTDNVNEADGYNNNKNYGKQYKPHSTYNDESSMMNAASAINMMKNMPSYSSSSSNDNSQNEPDIQSILSQFSSANMDHQGNGAGSSKINNAEFASSNDFGTFGSETLNAPNQMSDISGIAGFQPAPEGGQLPAPPGYKHVGYITIPAGATNLPNMMASPGSGLPIIRPIPIHNGEMVSKLKLDSKKNQDNKMSESKPVRSFLSRLNPLNMLKRLRQRRERRQTTDMSSSDYMTLPSKYTSGYGYSGGSMPSSYSMTPYTGYSSLSGLGGMSGVGGMYPSSAAAPASMYAMPSYGSTYPYTGYSSYAPSYSSYMSPASSYLSSTDPKGSAASTSELTASASALSPTGMAMAPQSMAMPMMIPMSSYGSYGGSYGGYGGMPMGSYPAPMHAPMPYGYGHMHHAPHYHAASSSSSSSSSSPSGASSNDQQSLSQTQLPGGINLSDLLKDEEDEPSKFRKFLGYMNPMNIFKRFRNNTNDDQKRLGRYRRDVTSSLYDISSANDTELSDAHDLVESDEMNNSSAVITTTMANTADIDPMEEEEEMSAEFTSHKAVHNHRKVGGKRTKANLMGSRNFEVLGGGTFQNGQHVPMQSIHSYNIDDASSSELSSTSSLVGDIDNSFGSGGGKPNLHGFQGFDSFTSHYNTLAAGTNRLPEFVEQFESNVKGGGAVVGDGGKSFRSIERASITETELSADA